MVGNESTTTTNPSTTFVDQAEIKYFSRGEVAKTDDLDVFNQRIADFLEKPFLQSTFTWNSTDTTNSVLATLSGIQALQANTLWVNKYQGYNLLRGNFHVRVIINANPFQQGRLLGHFFALCN